jgi:hypothetical protein
MIDFEPLARLPLFMAFHPRTPPITLLVASVRQVELTLSWHNKAYERVLELTSSA